MDPDKPTNDDEDAEPDTPNANHYKKPFDSNLIDTTRPLITIAHPTLGNVAILGWVGMGDAGEKIRQPALWLHQDVLANDVFYISYQGFTTHMSYGDKSLRKSDILLPTDGSVVEMRHGEKHYFNNYSSLTPNFTYAIDKNNASMRINNVSIFNAGLVGCMLNLRASFDGLLYDEKVKGNVIVLCTIDTIG